MREPPTRARPQRDSSAQISRPQRGTTALGQQARKGGGFFKLTSTSTYLTVAVLLLCAGVFVWNTALFKSIQSRVLGAGVGPHDKTPAAAPTSTMSAQQASTPHATRRLVIVGGGLAGVAAAVTAAAEAHQAGVDLEVVLLEKEAKLGGNSVKASSGINAVNPQGGDSEQLFETDVLKSGGGMSKEALVTTLVTKSRDAVQFLESGGGLDLSGITRLGGHSVPRTRYSPKSANVGWVIMSGMITALRAASPAVKVMEGCKLDDIVVTDGKVTAVKYTRSVAGGESEQALLGCDAVVLASGGFSANRELLRRVNPAAAELPTTNGPWASGDVIPMAERLGLSLYRLEDVQVRPHVLGIIHSHQINIYTFFQNAAFCVYYYH